MSAPDEPPLRRASLEDAPAIAALHIASWRATYRQELTAEFLAALDLPQRTELWRERLATPGMHVLAVQEASSLIAFCSSGFTQAPDDVPTWEILNLHVHPERHGAGLGGRLFDAAVRLARDQGARALVLWVVASNRRAREFYERKAMRPDGARQIHELGPGGSLSEVRYRMEL